MIKAMRWSVGTPETDTSERHADQDRTQDVSLALVRDLSDARAERAAKKSITVEDALREMENAMSVQRELRASAQRLLTKLAST